MRLGRRDRLIRVQRYTEVRNAYNEIEPAWVDLYPALWAHKKTQSGKEALQAEQVVASNVVVFNIHYKPITAKDRVIFEGKVYDIEHPNEIGRRKEMELICLYNPAEVAPAPIS